MERIGKKYQWIALDELLCRLADNYWVGGRCGDRSKAYDNPLDIGFERDVDPTVISLSDDTDNSQGSRPDWVVSRAMELESVSEEHLAEWPFIADPAAAFLNLVESEDDDGKSWVTLYEHRTATRKYDDGKPELHGLRQQAFHFVMCVILGKADREKLADFVSREKSIDAMAWAPLEFTDGPFLREAPWRHTWTQKQWSHDVWKAPKGMAIAFPTSHYHWESHLDASLPEGARAFIPSPWLAKALSVSAEKCDAAHYKDSNSQTVFLGTNLRGGGSIAVIAKDALNSFLEANNLECFWLFVGERNAWPGGNNDCAAWRRSEGICWLENGRPVALSWNRDNANGASKAVLEKVFTSGCTRMESLPSKQLKSPHA